MDYSDLLKSGLGAVIGFMLAQLVNLAMLGRDWFTRPRLRIEPSGENENWRILKHSAQTGVAEFYDEERYAFYVQNVGRSIATGVRFQLLKIEYRRNDRTHFSQYSDDTHDLSTYSEFGDKRVIQPITLVPGAKIIVYLGSWREDYDFVEPAINAELDYYEETCGGAVEFRFTVVAFDDRTRFITAVATIRPRQ